MTLLKDGAGAFAFTPSGRWFLLLVLSFTFFFIPSTTAINDSWLYYDFDYTGNLTYIDTSIPGETLDLVSTDLNTLTSFSHLGDFGLYGSEPDGYYAVSPKFTATSNETANTTSFWAYFPNYGTSTGYQLFGYGTYDSWGLPGYAIGAQTAGTDGVQLIIQHGSGAGSACATTTGSLYKTNNNFSFNTWHHIVYVYNASNAGYPYLFVNGNDEPWTSYSGGIDAPKMTDTSGNRSYLSAGIANGCSAFGLRASSFTTSASYVDELNIYNRELSSAEIEQLYNSGYGYNPYTNETPTQIASIANILLGTQSSESRDLGDYFIGETNISINFSYDSASYEAYYGAYANAGDFAILFTDIDSAIFYSYSAQVPQTAMTLSACNNNGCTNTTIYFEVSGFGTPTAIGSIDDWSIVYDQTETREFSDYFAGYTRRFLQYTDPDDGVTVVNVSSGFPANNTCFSAAIVGDTLQVRGENSIGCSVDAVMTVDDTLTSASSNAFTIIITPISQIGGGEILSYFSNFLDVFPSSDDLDNTTKSLFVFVFVLVIIVSSVFLVREGADAKIVGIGSAVAMFFLLIFFTAIGYIPIWIIIMLFLLLAVLGIGFMRSRVMGV